jgi:hypothetical protein
VECDRKIQRALKRLADEDAKAAIAISVSEVTLVSATRFDSWCVLLLVTTWLVFKSVPLLTFADGWDIAAIERDQAENERGWWFWYSTFSLLCWLLLFTGGYYMPASVHIYTPSVLKLLLPFGSNLFELLVTTISEQDYTF